MKYAGIAAITLVALSPVISVVIPSNMITVVQADEAGFPGVDNINIVFPSKVFVEEGSKIEDIDDPEFFGAILDNKNGRELATIYNIKHVYDDDIYSDDDEFPLQDLPVGTRFFEHATCHELSRSSLTIGDTFNLNQNGKLHRKISLDFYGDELNLIKKVRYYLNDNVYLNGHKYDYSSEHLTTMNQVNIHVSQEIEVVPKSNGGGNIPKPEVISGTVTTHSDQPKYSIYDDNNSDAEHRSLMATSSWHTDRVRTINGIKQYRVSSHGWVNASDVTYVPDGEMHSKLVVTKLDKPIKIHVSNEHPHHSLQNVDRDFITHRALDGGTDWMVDKIGKDIHGRIYYGVSTNEFVHNSYGVSEIK